MDYRTWTPGEALPAVPRSVALGVFDGMHLGHRAVIAAARNVISPRVGIPFPTVTVLSLAGVPKSGGRLLTPAQEQAVAQTLGVDEWLQVPFNTVQHLSAEAFVREVLHGALHATVVCCGYNFHFGKGGTHGAEDLRCLCAPLGIEVRIVPAVERDGEAVSSTAVRCALEAGQPKIAAGLLGRPYAVAFPVQAGAHRGTDWGFPTVNQPFPAGYIVPRHGVYASLVVVDGVQYRAVTNVGCHPTVGGSATPQAETYIEGYTGDLYGRTLSVELIRFLREEQQFTDVTALRECIAADRNKSVALLSGAAGDKAVLFDFDDTLQNRVQAFGGMAQELAARYFPTLSAVEQRERARIMVKENANGRGYVDYHAYARGLRERWGWETSDEQWLEELWRRFPFHTVLLPQAAAVLRELKHRGYRVGIITNGHMLVQNLKLDASGLRPLVDTVAVGGEEGVQKPNPELFYRAAARLCVAPKNCVYVGDYVPNDIVGAQAAGMRPLYIDVHGEQQCPAGVESITSLPQLLEIL